jgi:hypothetical protein
MNFASMQLQLREDGSNLVDEFVSMAMTVLGSGRAGREDLSSR